MTVTENPPQRKLYDKQKTLIVIHDHFLWACLQCSVSDLMDHNYTEITQNEDTRYWKVVPPAGFEPAAPGLGILRSIQLSYGGSKV